MLACLALTPAVHSEPREPGPDLPVLGQALVAATSDAEERLPSMVVTVHGLRRIGDATVLYYSVGFADEAPDPELAPVTAYGSGPGTFETLQSAPGATFMDSAAAIDVPGKVSYGALRGQDGRAIAAPAPAAEDDRARLSGRAVVQWIALAPIPAKTTIVDILVGSVFLKGIPVSNGPLTPVSEDPTPAAGRGWPEINTFEFDKGSAQNAVLPLQPRTTTLPKKKAPTSKGTPTTKPSATASTTVSPSSTPSASTSVGP